MTLYTIHITVMRRDASDINAMKDMINICMYRAFQIKFERNFSPPDKWTMIIPDCNHSAKESIMERINNIKLLYNLDCTIRITE